ncbi:succinylglutamate desuccinylase/aspartoacylase family protein [Dongia sp.]|uniref:succinylglutamate desuccinylase/aspartoacylase family protein n=1 Tax=Dongia sp. TaxID=1977262 RepID=UPI0035B0BFE6
MAKSIERISLGSMSPGTERFLSVHRYGTKGARPKAYVQASIHSDEIPGMLAAHHLIRLLDEADKKGAIAGEIIVVPVANPIGLGQIVNGSHSGRYELRGGGNFNRHWPDLYVGLREAVEGKLGSDASANVAAIRAAIAARIKTLPADTELAQLKVELARLAHDADMVLDLHCDDEALMHVYMQPVHWPDFQDLAAELGARASLLCADSQAASFDETFSLPWTKLAAELGGKFPVPAACFATTIEFRGQADVFDEMASEDANGLFRFLQRHGALAGDPGKAPALQCDGTDLEATDITRVNKAGVIAYKVALGAQVKRGDVIADLIDPLADDPLKARTAIRAGTDGLVLSRCLRKLVAPGDSISMIVGTAKLAHRKAGALLSD